MMGEERYRAPLRSGPAPPLAAARFPDPGPVYGTVPEQEQGTLAGWFFGTQTESADAEDSYGSQLRPAPALPAPSSRFPAPGPVYATVLPNHTQDTTYARGDVYANASDDPQESTAGWFFGGLDVEDNVPRDGAAPSIYPAALR